MGVVYRARDPRLGRDVALKILSEALVADPSRVARFEREARTLAALNHPNVGGIHGLETAGGVTALVLELVEGPTLADRLVEGTIPLDEALGLAQQIAAGLQAAHDLGIVHRDLKPANIKIRRDGTVKVLDFGLAKALGGPADDEAATVTDLATHVGTIMGTPAYMSPEQARGEDGGPPGGHLVVRRHSLRTADRRVAVPAADHDRHARECRRRATGFGRSCLPRCRRRSDAWCVGASRRTGRGARATSATRGSTSKRRERQLSAGAPAASRRHP